MGQSGSLAPFCRFFDEPREPAFFTSEINFGESFRVNLGSWSWGSGFGVQGSRLRVCGEVTALFSSSAAIPVKSLLQEGSQMRALKQAVLISRLASVIRPR